MVVGVRTRLRLPDDVLVHVADGAAEGDAVEEWLAVRERVRLRVVRVRERSVAVGVAVAVGASVALRVPVVEGERGDGVGVALGDGVAWPERVAVAVGVEAVGADVGRDPERVGVGVHECRNETESDCVAVALPGDPVLPTERLLDRERLALAVLRERLQAEAVPEAEGLRVPETDARALPVAVALAVARSDALRLPVPVCVGDAERVELAGESVACADAVVVCVSVASGVRVSVDVTERNNVAVRVPVRVSEGLALAVQDGLREREAVAEGVAAGL